MDPNTLPDGATLTRRFGVTQKVKVRQNWLRSSLVNASVTRGVHHVAALCAEYMRQSGSKGSKVELAAECRDLASAYKQAPLFDAAFELDSYLVVYNPHLNRPEVYQQKVPPFGSIASVTAFLRCALAIWDIGSVLLCLTWSGLPILMIF